MTFGGSKYGFPLHGGASFHCARMPRSVGRFLALTGHPLVGQDVFAAGIATHYIPSGMLTLMQEQLEAVDGNVESVLSHLGALQGKEGNCKDVWGALARACTHARTVHDRCALACIHILNIML